jgi:hypothetical protein
MVSLILWALAPIFNAIMDLVENENFYQSIFSKTKEVNQLGFWYKRESWKYAKKIFGYKLDAWHIAKSIMIILVTVSSVVAYYQKPVISWYIDLALRGLIWNLVFNLFYNHIFRIKK